MRRCCACWSNRCRCWRCSAGCMMRRPATIDAGSAWADFSLLGDVLLAWPGDLFVFGLGAFLVAHLAYLKAYLSDCRRLALLPLILALSVGAVLLGILISNGLGPLLIPGDRLRAGHQRHALARPGPTRH